MTDERKPIRSSFFSLHSLVSLLVLALFLGVRAPLLALRAPFFDELFTRWIAGRSFAGILSALRQDSGPPLYYVVVRLFGDPSVVAIRGLSLMFAGLSVVLILRLGGESSATIAALLLALFPPAVLFAVDARAYGMCAMFVTIAVLALDRDRPFAASLALVAAAYSHYYGVLLFPILLFKTAGEPAEIRWRHSRFHPLALATFLYLPGFWLALHQPAAARAWMTWEWPDALFVRPPVALAIIGAIVLAVSVRANRHLAMVLIPLILAIALRVYVPMRFEAVIAAPLALGLAESLGQNRFRLPLLTALLAIGAIWSMLGIIDHARRPPDAYRQAALWAAGNIPSNEIVVASGYCYLETLMNGHGHVVAFPAEQGEHPGWRALPQPGVPIPPGAFLWIGERRAPELGILLHQHRSIKPLYINNRAMVALVR